MDCHSKALVHYPQSCRWTKTRTDRFVNFDLLLDLGCDRHDRVVDLDQYQEHWKRQLQHHGISCKLKNKAKERRHNYDKRRWPLADFKVFQKVAERRREIDQYVEYSSMVNIELSVQC